MEAGELSQRFQTGSVDRHIAAALDQRPPLALHMLFLHQKRHRLTAGVQRPLNDYRTLGNEEGVCRVSPVYQLILRQSGIDVQFRGREIMDAVYHGH